MAEYDSMLDLLGEATIGSFGSSVFIHPDLPERAYGPNARFGGDGGESAAAGGAGVPAVTNYQLTLAAGNGGRILSGQGSYSAGSAVSITAEALPGYKFDRWTTGAAATFANVYSAATTFTMPGTAATVVANFLPVSASTADTEAPASPSAFISDNGVSPKKLTFYVNDPQDISVSIRTGVTYLLKNIRLGGYKLVEGEDYHIEDGQYLISAKYLSAIKKGDNIFTFDMNAGIDPQLIISIKSK
jgi:hypothetical protein